MVLAHIGAFPVEELLPLAPTAGAALLALAGGRRAAARAQRERRAARVKAGARPASPTGGWPV
jgi:hypothetical protein